MKTIFLCLLFVSTFAASAFAAKTDMFKVDEQKVNTQMDKLNKLENYVNTHPGTTLSQLKQSNNALVANLNLRSTSNLGTAGDGPLGIPSFWWGCILGVIGIAIVYFTTNDTDEAKKALWGCLIWVGVDIIFYIIYFALVLKNASTTVGP